MNLSHNNNINNNIIINWVSQLQKTVVLSLIKAKYMVLRDAVKKATYLNNTFIYINNNIKLGLNIRIPVILVDNTSIIKLAENPEFYKRSKYIDIIYHFNRETVNNKQINIKYIPTKLNMADFLTNLIFGPLYKEFIKHGNINNGENP